MNVGRQQVPKGVVNESVLGEAAQASEAGRGDTDVEMATTVPCAGVPGVPVALVRNLEKLRVEVCREPAADGRDPVGRTVVRHGMTWTNGLMLTALHTPAVT